MALNIPQIRLEKTAERKRRFLGYLSLILLGANLLTFCFLTLPTTLRSGLNIISAISTSLGVAVPLFGYWAGRWGSTRWVTIASWFIISYTNLTLVFFTLSAGADFPVSVFFIMTTLLSLFLLPWIATLLFSLLGIAVTFSAFFIELSQGQAQRPIAAGQSVYLHLVIWGVGMGACTAICLVLGYLFNQAERKMYQQAEELNSALQEIARKYQLSQMVSQRINSVTVELNSTATQQAVGSQQQVAAINSIGDLMQRLSVAAQTIEARSQSIEVASQNVLIATQEMEEVTQEVNQVSEQGLSAVQQSINSQEQVGMLYDQLVVVVEDLQQRSEDVKAIVKLIQTVANETHLLALNAAIEAAGAGTYGTRFAVVAGEVKSLADRTIHASKQVNDIMQHFETGIYQVLQVSEKGRSQTQHAIQVGQQSGQIIQQLAESIRQTLNEAGRIQTAIIAMNDLTHEIARTTTYQSSTSHQAVSALQEVSTVAIQSASSSEQVKNTVFDLEELSYTLNNTLNNEDNLVNAKGQLVAV